MTTKKLYLSKDNRIIAGVAGGLGEYLNIDPNVVRVIIVIAAVISFGTLTLLYIVTGIFNTI